MSPFEGQHPATYRRWVHGSVGYVAPRLRSLVRLCDARAMPASKFREDVAEAIIARVAKGMFIGPAAKARGLSGDTVRSWIAIGEGRNSNLEAREPYLGFALAIRKAESFIEGEAMAGILEAGKKDWRALAFFLSKRFPSRYGDKISVDAEVTELAPMVLRAPPREEDLRKWMERYRPGGVPEGWVDDPSGNGYDPHGTGRGNGSAGGGLQ